MENYPNQELKAIPQPKPYHPMTDKELSQILNTNFNYNILIPALIESNRRKDKSIAELNKRIVILEDLKSWKTDIPANRMILSLFTGNTVSLPTVSTAIMNVTARNWKRHLIFSPL